MSTDFEYNIYDVQQLKSAYQDLLAEESIGYKYGLIGSVVSYLALRRFTYFRHGSRLLTSVIFGSQTYGFYTHRARSYYGYVAQQVNTHASSSINDCFGH